MRLRCVEILNFRKLRSTRIDLDAGTTLLVGANNSGKTSAMVALRYFLLSPESLALRDVTIANWTQIDRLGAAWEAEEEASIDLDSLLPALDVWLDVPLGQIQHVAHLLPTLDWSGGALGVRLAYRVEALDKLEAAYLAQRTAAKEVSNIRDDSDEIVVWPRSLTDFLDRRLHAYVKLIAYPLDPDQLETSGKDGRAIPQQLAEDALPIEGKPFRGIIKIDDIVAQRDFADAGGGETRGGDWKEPSRRFKRRLSDQLRSYHDRHLDPYKMPSESDRKAIGAMQAAERSFDDRLQEGFAEAFEELEGLGYPGINNPKPRVSTRLQATDGLKHGSAVQYAVADPSGDGTESLMLPEDYSGLGYQNLIAMVFMLMGFRDEWMRVGKHGLRDGEDVSHEIEPLHLVLVEEPEAHLHAQVQQVFIGKAYGLLRNRPELGKAETYWTQLVVSTHSSHVAHEADFASLRYFRRRPAPSAAETPTTTVANLSQVFGAGDTTTRFVKRYLKATHCDLFFADGVVFVEGQAERILVPHFIREHYEELSRRYVSLIEIGGSHVHRFRDLIEELGIATLIVADLDATVLVETKDKKGTMRKTWNAAKPEKGKDQRTANTILKEWHPETASIDELIDLPAERHVAAETPSGYPLYIAYQKPIKDHAGENVIPRTFEDALIIGNSTALKDLEGSTTSRKVREIVEADLSGDALADALFDLLKDATKGDFAIDCLMLSDPKALEAPSYIAHGLKWLQRTLSEEIAAREPMKGETDGGG